MGLYQVVYSNFPPWADQIFWRKGRNTSLFTADSEPLNIKKQWTIPFTLLIWRSSRIPREVLEWYPLLVPCQVALSQESNLFRRFDMVYFYILLGDIIIILHIITFYIFRIYFYTLFTDKIVDSAPLNGINDPLRCNNLTSRKMSMMQRYFQKFW